MATTNHTVTVGTFSLYGSTTHGYNSTIGSITPSNGPGALNVPITGVSWTDPSSGDDFFRLAIQAEVQREALSQVTVGGTTFTQASASSFSSGSGTSFWTWITPTNPLGTSGTVAVSIQDNAAESLVTISGFNNAAVTEDESIAFTTTIENGSGKYFNWDLVRISGTEESGGEISSATFGSLTDTGGTVTLTFHDNSTSEVGLNGESFRFDVYEYTSPTTPTGSPSGTPKASRTFILYDNDVTASFPVNTTIVHDAGNAHTLTLTVGTGSDTSYRVYWGTGINYHDISSKSVGTHSISIPDAPTAIGETKPYDVYAYNGYDYLFVGSYSVERLEENASPPSSTYGIEVFDDTGALSLNIDDETLFYKVRKTGTIAAGGTSSFTEADLGLPTGYLSTADITLVTDPPGSIYYDGSFKFGYVRSWIGLNFLSQTVLYVQNSFNTSKAYDVTVFSRGAQ